MPETPFSAQIRRYRKEHGLTQEALAELAGISARAISDLERGMYRKPHRHTVEALASAFRLSGTDLEAFRDVAFHPPARGPELGIGSPLGSVPIALNRLIGRDRDFNELMRLVSCDNRRLVTLTGTAGVGKTRLAIEIAHHLAESGHAALVWVSLATATAADVPRSTGRAFGLADQGVDGLAIRLARLIDSRDVLLALDNFEHVTAAAPFLSELLSACPSLRILVTSRAPLHLTAEQIYRLEPLALPSLPSPRRFSAAPSSRHDDAAPRSPAVELFLDRAREHNPALVVDADSSPLIACICMRLDGLPLALELAAPWLASVSPAQLLELLETDPHGGHSPPSHLLDLLQEGAGDQPERLRTMRNAIGWSYRLLEPAGCVTLRRAAVFEGNFSLDALIDVCEPLTTAAGSAGEHQTVIRESTSRSTDRFDRINTVRELVTKNLLVHRGEHHAGSRYQMLETIRAYAMEQLDASGEADTLLARHIRCFLDLAECAEPHLVGPEQSTWLDRLQSDYDNIRAAVRRAVAARDVETSLRFGAALWRFWSIRGYLAEGRELLQSALEIDFNPVDVSPVRLLHWGRALRGAGSLAFRQGDFRAALSFFWRSREVGKRVGDERLMAQTEVALAETSTGLGDCCRADRLLEMAGARYDALDDHVGRADIAVVQIIAANASGRYQRALVLINEQLDELAGLERPTLYAGCLTQLGIASAGLGDFTSAESALNESLSMLETLEAPYQSALALEHRAGVMMRQGKRAQAKSDLSQCVSLRQLIGDPVGLGHCYRRLHDLEL